MSTEIQEVTTAPSRGRARFIVPLLILLGVVGILLFAYFVWPSHYEYSDIYLGFLGTQTLRTDRFSDEAHVCGSGTWYRVKIEGETIHFMEEMTMTIGVKSASCPRAPLGVVIALAIIGVVELGLIVLLVFGAKKQDKESETEIEETEAPAT